MLDTVIEYTAVLCNAIYLILISQKKIVGWIFGVLASALTMYYCLRAGLNAEAFLMLFYIGAGFYGYYAWKKKSLETSIDKVHGTDRNPGIQIVQWSLLKHLLFIAACAALSGLVYLIVNEIPGSKKPLLDSFTTGFAILVTFMVAVKELHNWLYWLVINGVSIYLYLDRELEVYAYQMIGFQVMAIYGYYQWIKLYKNQKA